MSSLLKVKSLQQFADYLSDNAAQTIEKVRSKTRDKSSEMGLLFSLGKAVTRAGDIKDKRLEQLLSAIFATSEAEYQRISKSHEGLAVRNMQQCNEVSRLSRELAARDRSVQSGQTTQTQSSRQAQDEIVSLKAQLAASQERERAATARNAELVSSLAEARLETQTLRQTKEQETGTLRRTVEELSRQIETLRSRVHSLEIRRSKHASRSSRTPVTMTVEVIRTLSGSAEGSLEQLVVGQKAYAAGNRDNLQRKLYERIEADIRSVNQKVTQATTPTAQALVLSQNKAQLDRIETFVSYVKDPYAKEETNFRFLKLILLEFCEQHRDILGQELASQVERVTDFSTLQKLEDSIRRGWTGSQYPSVQMRQMNNLFYEVQGRAPFIRVISGLKPHASGLAELMKSYEKLLQPLFDLQEDSRIANLSRATNLVDLINTFVPLFTERGLQYIKSVEAKLKATFAPTSVEASVVATLRKNLNSVYPALCVHTITKESEARKWCSTAQSFLRLLREVQLFLGRRSLSRSMLFLRSVIENADKVIGETLVSSVTATEKANIHAAFEAFQERIGARDGEGGIFTEAAFEAKNRERLCTLYREVVAKVQQCRSLVTVDRPVRIGEQELCYNDLLPLGQEFEESLP